MLVVHGDITTQHADAIVNATDPSLLGGAVHRRGDPAVLAECRALRASAYRNGLPFGRAVATTGGELRARWVIHTAGPVWSAGEDRSALLASCYRESLRIAGELGAGSVAFPAISTGAGGWPPGDAAAIAVRALRAAPTGVEEVRFVTFTPEVRTAFTEVVTSDENIAAGLAAHPAQRWRRLFAAVDALTPADRAVTWETPEHQLPYPRYTEGFWQVVRLLAELDVVVPFDWGTWSRDTPLHPEGRGLAGAPVADAARLATAYIRGERFCEGTLESGLGNGALDAIFDRLRRWFTEEHGGGR